MPLFHYTARGADGANKEGTVDAEDQYALARTLRSSGLTVLSINSASSSAKKFSINKYIPNIFKRVSLEEKMNFTRNIAVMIGAGLSLTRSLEVMSRQTRSAQFKEIILALAETIKSGKTFADALNVYPKIFPKYYQEMVRAGEKSGKLEYCLKLIAMQLNKDYQLRRKIRSAMMYPLIIMIAMVGIGILMMIYVVPTLIGTFKELNIDLPASTRFIIFVSESLLQSGLILLAGVVVIALSIYRFVKTQRGIRFVDAALIKLPVIGGINKKFNSARTCRTLSSLTSSGVNILEALTITEGVIQNHLFQNVLKNAKERIQRGEIIAGAFLDEKSVYPPLVGEMISVGEESGELSQMLFRLAVFYENEVAAATRDLSTIIEPVLMILIGIVVGFFAVSMISPMYSMVGGI